MIVDKLKLKGGTICLPHHVPLSESDTLLKLKTKFEVLMSNPDVNQFVYHFSTCCRPLLHLLAGSHVKSFYKLKAPLHSPADHNFKAQEKRENLCCEIESFYFLFSFSVFILPFNYYKFLLFNK